MDNLAEILKVDTQNVERSLRNFRREELAYRQKPSTLRVLVDASPRVLILVAAYAGAVLMTAPYSYIAAVLFGVETASIMASWFHDGIHIERSKRPWYIRVMIRVASAPLGISPLWWAYKHVLLHHKYVGQADKDPDIQFGWLLRVSVDQPWKPTHRFQHIYVWLLYPFASFNMLKPGEIYQSRYLEQRTGHHFQTSMSRCLFDKYLPFVVAWTPIAITQGYRTLLIFVIYQAVAGSLTAVVSQVQHNTLKTLDNYDIPYDAPLSRQVFLSNDVASKSGIWQWISGGVNFHAIHHLIPSLSLLETPNSTARLRAFLCEDGLDVPTHSGIVPAFLSHVRLLHHLSKPSAAVSPSELLQEEV